MKIDEFLSQFTQFEPHENPNLRSLMTLIGDSIPDTPYGQQTSAGIIARVTPKDDAIHVLDVGCGKGKTRDVFLKQNPNVVWYGLDIAESNHVENVDVLPEGVQLYDGINIPFDDKKFDLVYSNQVFEHVRHPLALLKEIARVTKPGGKFFGSVSNLEPYHYHSLFNYTPYGWYTIVKDNDFKPLELSSGIDGISLILHHYSKNRDALGRHFKNSALNRVFEMRKTKTPREQKFDNLMKVIFSGHRFFITQRVER